MSTTPSTSSLATPARRTRSSRARKTRRNLLPCCLLALSFASLTTANTALSPPLCDLSTDFPSHIAYPLLLKARGPADESTTITAKSSRTAAATSHRTSTSAAVAVAVPMELNNVGSQASSSVTVINPSGTSEAGGSVATGTGTTSASAAISTSTAVPASYTLPRAFDSSLGNSFVDTACPSFFQTFLANPTFISCAPFSLLLTTSSAFFKAERCPYSLLPFILDASCAAPIVACTNLMASLDTLIRQPGTCGPDLAAGNALATQAQMGFMNYPLMREAGCQKNNKTDQFCFAEAAAASASELYFYYLAEGTNLPSGTVTKCSSCTQGLFEIFSRYATNTTLPISKTYSTGRSVAAQACGPSFAPFIATAVSGAGSVATIGGWVWSLVLLALGVSAGVC